MAKDQVAEAPVEETEAKQNVASTEEIEKQRKDLSQFYDDEIPLLEKRAVYEELVTRIEESRFNRFQIKVAKAQIMSPSIPEGSPEMPSQEKPVRKLRED